MFLLVLDVSVAAADVGVRRIHGRTGDGKDTEFALFYPSDAALETSAIGPYDVMATIGAPASSGRFPLILISHGSQGSMLSHHDLASYLAMSGFVVAAVEHPGDNYRDGSGLGTLDIYYRRARQVSAVIDTLLEGPYGELVDRERIGIVGYSAGTATALMLAGATPDFEALIDYCVLMKKRTAICADGGRRARGSTGMNVLADQRIRAALLLAPMGAIFSHENPRVTIPVGIVAAASDQELPIEWNVKPLVDRLSNLTLVDVIPLAGHSIFLAPCSARLKASAKDLCSDPPLVDRRREHALLNGLALSFFRETLRSNGPRRDDGGKNE